MKNLIIIGARGWGREVLWSFQTDPVASKEYRIKGFLDSKKDALDGLNGTFPPILSSVEEYEIDDDDVFICALGDPHWRKFYVDVISKKGGKFITFVGNGACVSPNAKIGKGTFVSGSTCISDNVIVGDHCVIHGLCTLGHDVKISNFVSIEAYCFFGGYSSVGEGTSIHVRSTILSHKKVGANASVGAGSVVIRNVKDNQSVFGNPAKKIE